ncbi:Splicing factor 3B subunit 5/RDS3 complex subunit 10 [Perkinsela sp. CCAP 1560/4]|nr:Splicing factor 3B subunit 5/RDS3 complex subunit 10 [Perkinsela sp. CCAP 1560/4]|eukprot:KNH03792.1 Splicing factor 3B subunit 5/RDS3 complex subunit 10 [Perkinsela sp. CCAP 1560/4]
MSDPFLRPGEPDSKHAADVLSNLIGQRDADTSPRELMQEQLRDMHAFCYHFDPLTQYLAIADNLTAAEIRLDALRKLADPFGEH